METWRKLIAELSEGERRELLELVETSLSSSEAEILYEYADEMDEPQLSHDQLWGR